MSAAPPASPPFSALVIDDDEFVRGVLAQQLRTLGAQEVFCADSGQAARARLGQGEPVRLIVCDLMMPGIDGVELLRDIAECSPEAALILVSSAAPKVLRTAQEVAERRHLHVLGCLNKPIRLAALQALVATLHQTRPAAAMAPAAVIDEAQLRAALDADEFGIAVQPQICLPAQRLVGAEALVRWHSPTLGTLMPDQFLPLVERCGLLDRLSDRVLKLAIAACRDWRRQGLAVKVAVNFSPSTLAQRELPDRILALAAAAGLPPVAVIIEVTEQDVMQQLAGDPLEALTRLRLRDMEVSLDDFGTGHSSLERLRQTPFTELKIDRRFVAAAVHDEEARRIVESNLRLAHDLGLRAVAEGVETAADLQLMTQLGCDVVQGYFISRPIPAERLVGWSAERGLGSCCGQAACPFAQPGEFAGDRAPQF